MLTSLLTYILISNALTLRKDKSILFSRIVMVSLGLTSFLTYNSFFFILLDQGIGLYGGIYIITFIWNLFILYIIFTNSVNSNTNSNSNFTLDYIKGLIQTLWSNKAFLMKVSFIAIPLISLPRYLLFAKLHQAGFILDSITFIYISITIYPIIIFIFKFINLSLIQGSAIFNKNTFNVILNNTHNHLNVKSFTMYLFFILFYKYFLFYILVICISGETLYLSSNDDTTRDWQNRPVVVAESSSMAANRGVSNTTNWTEYFRVNQANEARLVNSISGKPEEYLYNILTNAAKKIENANSSQPLDLNNLSHIEKDLIKRTLKSNSALAKAIANSQKNIKIEVSNAEALKNLRAPLLRGPSLFVKETNFLTENRRLHTLGDKVPYTGNRFDQNIALQNKNGANLYIEGIRQHLEKNNLVWAPFNENYKYFEQILNTWHPNGELTNKAKISRDKDFTGSFHISRAAFNNIRREMNESPLKDYMFSKD